MDLFEPQQFEMQRSATFSGCHTMRREIRRRWVREPKFWVSWLMLNPSVAGADRDDMTANRVTQFTRRWGYDGWIGVNLYPFISSTQPEMWKWADWTNNGPDYYARDQMFANLDVVESVGREASLRMVAFGAEPVKRDEIWLENCLEAYSQPSDWTVESNALFHPDLFCLGVTKDKQPLHPMARGKWRVPDHAAIVPWRNT